MAEDEKKLKQFYSLLAVIDSHASEMVTQLADCEETIRVLENGVADMKKTHYAHIARNTREWKRFLEEGADYREEGELPESPIIKLVDDNEVRDNRKRAHSLDAHNESGDEESSSPQGSSLQASSPEGRTDRRLHNDGAMKEKPVWLQEWLIPLEDFPYCYGQVELMVAAHAPR